MAGRAKVQHEERAMRKGNHHLRPSALRLACMRALFTPPSVPSPGSSPASLAWCACRLPTAALPIEEEGHDGRRSSSQAGRPDGVESLPACAGPGE